MMMSRKRSPLVATLLLFGGLLLPGCASQRAFRDGEQAEQREHWDVAVLAYQRAYDADPSSKRARIALQRAKIRAAQVHFERGKIQHLAFHLDLAAIEFEQAVALDPTYDAAVQELKQVREEIAKRDRQAAGDTAIERAKEATRGMRGAPPMLSPSSNKPIDVTFPPDTPIKKIYQALGAAAGINIIYDPQLKDDKFTLDLRGMTFQKALETAMRQAGHFYKILDEHTILIAQDTVQNRREYEDLVIRTFFLSNGDVKDVSAMVRSILDLRRIGTIPQLNAIVIRDTADKVAVAERLIDVNDKAKAEVLVDVELILISTTDLMDLGAELNTASGIGGSVTASLNPSVAPTPVGSTSGTPGAIPWNSLIHLGLSDFLFTLPTATFNFIKSNSDAQTLAKPQLRIAEGEKAQLLIGERDPIPVTTVQTTTAIGATGVVPITSYQYQDVGIKMEIEPRVHHNKEITLKLTVEVSNLGPQINGQISIQTRTITSTIRLKEGETNFLAGLIRRDTSRTRNTIPFLGDLPLLGRLFSDMNKNDTGTDVFLTLTPHIIRAPQITEEDMTPIWVGTENNVSYSGLGARLESPSAEGSPFAPPEGRGARPVPTPAPRPTAAPFLQGAPPNDPFRQIQPSALPTPVPAPLSVPRPEVRQSLPVGGDPPATSAPVTPTPAPVPNASLMAPSAPTSKPALAPAGPATPILTMEAASGRIAPGEATSVSVTGVSGLKDLRSLEMTLEWDPAVVDVTGIAAGDGREEPAGGGLVLDADRAPGRARIRLLTPEGAWGMPQAELVRLKVRGVAPGTSLFRIAAGTAESRTGPVKPGGAAVPVTVAAVAAGAAGG